MGCRWGGGGASGTYLGKAIMTKPSNGPESVVRVFRCSSRYFDRRSEYLLKKEGTIVKRKRDLESCLNTGGWRLLDEKNIG